MCRAKFACHFVNRENMFNATYSLKGPAQGEPGQAQSQTERYTLLPHTRPKMSLSLSFVFKAQSFIFYLVSTSAKTSLYSGTLRRQRENNQIASILSQLLQLASLCGFLFEEDTVLSGAKRSTCKPNCHFIAVSNTVFVNVLFIMTNHTYVIHICE